MRKRLLIRQTNGHASQVGKPVRKSKLAKLKELEAEIKLLQEQELEEKTTKQHKKRKRKHAAENTPEKQSLKDKVRDIILLNKFIKDKSKSAKEIQKQVNEEAEKLAELEKLVAHYKEIYGGLKALQKLGKLPVTEREKMTIEILTQEIKRLQELDIAQREIITKDSINSPVVNAQIPEIKKTIHPIRLLQSWRQFQKEEKKFKDIVTNIDKTDINFTVSQVESSIEIRNNGTRGYKAENASMTKSYVKVGDTYYVTYYLSDLPRILYPDVLYKLLVSSMPFTVSTYVKPLNSNSLIKKIRSRIADLETQKRENVEKGKVQNYKVDKNYDEMTELAQELTHEVEKGYDVSFYITIEGKTEEEVKLYHEELKNLTDSIELYVTKYTYGQKKAFESILPFNDDKVREHRFLNTTGVSYMTPFLTKNMYNPKGIFLGVNTNQEGLIFIDPFTISNDPMRNNNMVILGVTGSGKSVMSKIVATRLYAKSTQILAIDPEGEYLDYAKAMGGEIIQFSRDNGINPFSIYSTSPNLRNDILDHIGALKAFFKFFVRPDRFDASELDDILMYLYEDYPRMKPTFTVFLEKLKKSKMYRDIAVLEKGSLQGVFNSDRELHLGNDLVVFDISSLKDTEMKAPAMYLLTSLVWQLVDKNREKRKMLFIDEAHNLLADREVAVFYRKVVKEARKRNVGVVSITQNVEDFLQNEWGVGIITNSETKILLKQPTASFDLLDKIAVMSQEEKLMLGNLPIGEFILIREQEHIHAFMYVLPSERKYVFTTPGKNKTNENID